MGDNNNYEPRSSAQCLYFDPDLHPEATLKAFDEFCDAFTLRYNALYPDPPKVSMDAAIARWKVEAATAANADPRPTLAQYDNIRDTWREHDRVAKFLGLFSSKRFFNDWVAAQPDEALRNAASWTLFRQYIREFYKPTENSTLKNFHFRELTQGADETFTAFANRVAKEAGHCSFKCAHEDCTAEQIATRDQILIGTHYHQIREEALLKSWNLASLRTEGMKMESALKGGSEIGGGGAVNKVGKYSFKNTKQPPQSQLPPQNQQQRQKRKCYHCGTEFRNLRSHLQTCQGKTNKCSNCQKMGHLPSVCRSNPANAVSTVEEDHNPGTDGKEINVVDTTYNVNLFAIDTYENSPADDTSSEASPATPEPLQTDSPSDPAGSDTSSDRTSNICIKQSNT